MKAPSFRIGAAAAAALATLCLAMSASALDKVRVGKSVGWAFQFTPIEVGQETGIFKKHGLEVERLNYRGDAKMQQGLTAGAIDLGLGSGPGLGFIAKGVPAKGVAAFAGPPLALGLTVGAKTPIRTVEDLKGKKIGVTTAGSLTYWLGRELSRRMGWGPDGIQTVPLGGAQAQIAALKRGQIDGFIISVAVGYKLEKTGDGRLLLKFGDHIKDFITHVVFATNTMIKDHPDRIRRFLSAWVETIRFMRANKERTIQIARKITKAPGDIAGREYDEIMPMLTTDLHFDPGAMKTLARSFTELGILPKEPDPKTLYTEAFLPKAN